MLTRVTNRIDPISIDLAIRNAMQWEVLNKSYIVLLAESAMETGKVELFGLVFFRVGQRVK